MNRMVIEEGRADFERALAQYPWHAAVVAGYLPHDAAAIADWLEQTREAALAAAPAVFHPAVQALADLIDSDGVVRMYVTEMLAQVPPAYRKIATIGELLAAFNYIVGHAPAYHPDPKKRNFFPVSTLFVYMMYTPAGDAAFRNEQFNSALRRILREWCAFLDSPASRDVLNTGEYGWLSPSAVEYSRLDEFVVPDHRAPHWGFASFNAYFHREIKPQRRPIAAPDDARVIVSANDGTVFQIARGVAKSDTFWLKSQPYSLSNILDGSETVERFVGGDILQAFLSGADYHRWHAPVGGIVREARVVNGLMFSELLPLGFDPQAGVMSQGYQASVNTRALVVIDSGDPAIGLVGVVPVGITEISSITVGVKAGQRVVKGEELGYFSYGGSTLCMLFQRGAIKEFTVQAPDGQSPGSALKVNGQIARAN